MATVYNLQAKTAETADVSILNHQVLRQNQIKYTYSTCEETLLMVVQVALVCKNTSTTKDKGS